MKMNEPYNITNDKMVSHVGIPNGTRVIMVIGEVNGIIDNTVANVELGSATTDIDRTKPKIMGTTTIDCSCPAS